MTVGEKNQKKTNKTILLVGETGAGKSTLINALVNYTMGVKWEDEVWFKIVEEEEKSQSVSQTSDVIVYEIFGFEDETLPYSLTIIDTPGYGATKGIESDVIVSERLFDLFRSDDGVQEVHAVGLVMKASDNRLSDRLRYIFDSVMSLFGKNLEKNIVALITHSDGVTPEDALEALEAAKIKCARKEDEPVYFLFNNQQKKKRRQKDKVGLDNAWRVSEGGMSEFSEFLENIEPQKLMTTVEVLNERIRLTACIQNLQERMDFIELKQTEIKQTQEALKKHEDEMKINKEFTIEFDEVSKVREDIEVGWWCLLAGYAGAVSCKVCEENCHYPGCTMAWKPAHCEVMKGGRCTSCTNKCPASDHVKERKIYLLIEKMKEEGDTGKVQKLEEMRSRVDEGARGALQYILHIPAVMKKFGKTLWNKMKNHQTAL
ncbi:cell division control protein 3-like [Pundamilia nyererei]|uniref:Cell division control protein 3-like n=1 Tax=Pundamilia nyererei TaxID=303518 RepID=A0A9Y6J5N4_9CICH|nr:PREDICTED: cell division control protein 3-like [Pundamilia nyererei]